MNYNKELLLLLSLLNVRGEKYVGLKPSKGFWLVVGQVIIALKEMGVEMRELGIKRVKLIDTPKETRGRVA